MERDIYKANYLQKPISILSEENLELLEKHCIKNRKQDIGRRFREHEIVFELIQAYKEQQAELEKKEHKYRDLELKYEQNLEFSKLFRKELNKKDKIINEMANNFLMFRADTISPTNIEGIKQFFERIVEDDIK